MLQCGDKLGVLSCDVEPIETIRVRVVVARSEEDWLPLIVHPLLPLGLCSFDNDDPWSVRCPVVARKDLALEPFDIDLEEMDLLPDGNVLRPERPKGIDHNPMPRQDHVIRREASRLGGVER